MNNPKNIKEATNIISHLRKLSKGELVKEIQQISRDFPVVRDYYLCKFDVNDKEVLDKYKKIVRKEFFPDRGFGKMRLSIARKAVFDYKKISRNKESIVDIMLCYVENGIKFTNEYGDIDEPFYDSMGAMFESTLKYISDNKMREIFVARVERALKNARHTGWGFYDELEFYYEKYYKSVEGFS